MGCPGDQKQPGGAIGAVPSRGAVIAQYGLGAALSCDALGWKHAVGRRSVAASRAVRLFWEGSAVLRVTVAWARSGLNILKEADAAYNVTESKVWGRDG